MNYKKKSLSVKLYIHKEAEGEAYTPWCCMLCKELFVKTLSYDGGKMCRKITLHCIYFIVKTYKLMYSIWIMNYQRFNYPLSFGFKYIRLLFTIILLSVVFVSVKLIWLVNLHLFMYPLLKTCKNRTYMDISSIHAYWMNFFSALKIAFYLFTL